VHDVSIEERGREVSDDMKTVLVGCVLMYCKQYGLKEKDVLALFSKKVVYGAYKILGKEGERK